MRIGYISMLMLMMMAGLGLTGCTHVRSTSDIPAVADFQPDRYMGRWYEIARLPNRFEEGMTDAAAFYAPLPGDRISIMNTGFRNGREQRSSGVARNLYGRDIGEFQVMFLWQFHDVYKIIYVEPDYSAAIVTSSTRSYLWILARKPFIPLSQLGRYLAMLEKWGFDVKLLQYPSGELCSLAK